MSDLRTTVVASAVAALFAAGCSSSDDGNKNPSTGTGHNNLQAVKCQGINECKGTGECQSADGKNACQGQNECKGTGWVSVPTEQECKDKGGMVFQESQQQQPKTAAVKCDGINECAGHGACQGADNACKGKNSCKGKGYLEVPSEQECKDKGGTVRTG